MARTNAERQRDFRERRRKELEEGRRARVEAWKRQNLEPLEAELEEARDCIARLEEKLAASAAWCGTHGREKLCPACCGADEYA